MDQAGFIGVGAMGRAIAERLVRRGVKVLAHDVNPDALGNFVTCGGLAAVSNKQVADECEIVFACLPYAEVCKQVALGPGGVADGRRAKVYVETSTVGTAVARELAEGLNAKGITLIDSPVVGAQTALTAGTLGVLAAGPAAQFERVKPILELFAGRLFYLGAECGIGQTAKECRIV
ncbi:NAD(P)-binding domain-containing protein [Bradyrhizobium barranii subsp. apii]|uniref:NAD(P)-binding domain-containing protein n=1 Tax=Bradyrhizobium barranii subsp. apii TaxID=2819348 RepID=A0A8T5VG90_9BRAD|nr:NAD(P)-binding domain-containing protein [Bradyrhizobium barranii]UPT89199.1 NAD(P)-binding domain-containing protein [Bradyrhizobium barranii subsp. apii]